MTVAAVKSQTHGTEGTDLGDVLYLWCPGCDNLHAPCIRKGDRERPVWTWNGNLDAPTVEPSILVQGAGRCHSFMRDGQWQFLSDCSHNLAGRTVPLPPLPEWAA